MSVERQRAGRVEVYDARAGVDRPPDLVLGRDRELPPVLPASVRDEELLAPERLGGPSDDADGERLAHGERGRGGEGDVVGDPLGEPLSAARAGFQG